MNTIQLFRPVGIKELELIMQSRWKTFPPRLEWQPIFYPVLNQGYAAQIASEWNTKDPFSGHCGIVTGFWIEEEMFFKYDVQNVGGVQHNELWVPAEELSAFNASIVGNIEVLEVFYGKEFEMPSGGLGEVLLKLK